MHVHVRRACATFLLACGAAFLPSACVADESTIFARACLAIPDDTCSVDFSPSSPFLSGGFLDTATHRFEYSCALLVGNQLVARGDPNKLRTETSRVSLYEADVTLLMVPAGSTTGEPAVITRSDGSTAKFSTTISGFVDPGTGTTPGYGGARVTLIDAATAKDLGKQAFSTNLVQQVEARVIIRGRTLGGLEVETNEMRFPIDVGYGTSCDHPAGIVCNKVGTEKPEDSCHRGQDAVTDCRLFGADCLSLPPPDWK